MKLPTYQDLGATPPVSGPRPVASIDATPIAQGVERLGAGLEHLGEGLGYEASRQGRYQLALARSNAAAGEVELRAQFAQDPDYATMPQRFAEAVSRVYDEQAQTIQDSPVRAEFEASRRHDLANATVWAQGVAKSRADDAGRAYLIQSGQDTIQRGLQTEDPELQARLLDAHNQQVDAAAFLTPTQRLEYKQRFAKQFIATDANARIDRGDAESVADDLRAADAHGRFTAVEQKAGLPVGYIGRLFQIESGGNPDARTGSHRGLAQLSPGLETRYGITDENRADPMAQAAAVAQEATEQAPQLAQVLGRKVSAADLYLAHQQGVVGAAALMTHPDEPAWRAVRPYYKDDAAAKAAIAGNIPDGNPLKDLSVNQISAAAFVNVWHDKFNSRLGAPSAYAMLDPYDRRQLWLRAETAVQNQRRARDAQREVDQWTTRNAITDDLASMIRTGEGVNAVDPDRVKAVLGPQAFQQWQDARSDAHDIWMATHDLAYLPGREIAARVDALAPTAGAANFSRRQSVYQAVQKSAGEVLQQRRDDPAAAFDKDPLVQAARAQYNPQDPATFQQVAAARMELQEKAGIAAEARSPITRAEAIEMSKPLQTMLPGEERAALAQVGQSFQKMFGENAMRAFAFALRVHHLDAQVTLAAVSIARKLGLGQLPTAAESRAADEKADIDAATRIMMGTAPPL